MTGLDNILKEIKSESDVLVKNIISDAEKKAEEILKEAKEKGEVLAAEIKKAAEKKAEVIISRGKASAELSEKRAVLKKKQAIITEYINAAKERLEALEGKEYFEVLKRIIEKNASGAEGEIILSKADKNAVDSDFEKFIKEKNLKISDSELAGSRGVIIDYGNIEENCTFDAMFDSLSEELSDETMALLFE